MMFHHVSSCFIHSVLLFQGLHLLPNHFYLRAQDHKYQVLQVPSTTSPWHLEPSHQAIAFLFGPTASTWTCRIRICIVASGSSHGDPCDHTGNPVCDHPKIGPPLWPSSLSCFQPPQSSFFLEILWRNLQLKKNRIRPSPGLPFHSLHLPARTSRKTAQHP